ncbi:hypothetical protein Pcinc_043786 [Petrolisthes cinctipes]|uniref:Uncharacterized protein n=1 Tax=Petrolisthes cinctipes TaxID=88211 RepID=A0AAE1EET0_PETCI|nr:hypothetical protein Pcinc_043786 [Petrolisthes cinctipes]
MESGEKKVAEFALKGSDGRGVRKVGGGGVECVDRRVTEMINESDEKRVECVEDRATGEEAVGDDRRSSDSRNILEIMVESVEKVTERIKKGGGKERVEERVTGKGACSDGR